MHLDANMYHALTLCICKCIHLRHNDHCHSSKQASLCLLQLHVLPEGACEPAALLGCIRLIHWLAQPHVLGPDPLHLIVDCGTGTTATGSLAQRCYVEDIVWRMHLSLSTYMATAVPLMCANLCALHLSALRIATNLYMWVLSAFGL